jgi:hypothetical protein
VSVGQRVIVLAAVCFAVSAAPLMAEPGGLVRDAALARALGVPQPSVIAEPDNRWWHVNAATGWDSLYIDRGVNVMGNGNGLYWWAVDIPLTVWEGGTLTPGLWSGAGSLWNGANASQAFQQWLVFADLTQQLGSFSVSVGWEYIYVPTDAESQNEIYFGLAYDWSIGPVTVTPSALWYYNLGPQKGSPGGAINGGASYGLLGLSASAPVARNGVVALEPWAAFGINFNYNERAGDPLLGEEGEPFIGGNNLEFGLAVPLGLTRYFTLAPYLASSYQWQNLGAGAGSGTGLTADVTWWAGVSASFRF